MRLTVRTNLALCALVHCAAEAPRVVRKSDIAGFCGGSEAHLGIVVHRLAQLGFVETLRGRGGGVRLARPARHITVGQVVRAFEVEEEPSDRNVLSLTCGRSGAFGRALRAYFSVLDGTTIADLLAEAREGGPLAVPA